MNPDYDDPYNELIVHIPLEQEGQWFKIGKEVLNENDEVENFIHKMIHIPFGSGVILPITQEKISELLAYHWYHNLVVWRCPFGAHFIKNFKKV